ncbi:MAG TPA: hypothetical protein VLQ65_11990 [Saliniramus sp.]|nr:hypothetical protein [Saliniramus sp.]
MRASPKIAEATQDDARDAARNEASGIAPPDPARAPASIVRAVRADDIPAIGRLFQHVFRKSNAPPSAALTDYLHRLFVAPLAAQAGDEDAIVSLVHESSGGAVTGFIGIIAMPILVDGEKRRAAFAGTLMVDDRIRDPLAGPRLLRGFLAGPQDVSLSETANEVSQTMWRKLRGTVLPDYSLEWLRIFRPAAFAVASAAVRWPVLSTFQAAAVPLDFACTRLMHTAPARLEPAFRDETIDDDALAMLLERCTAHYPVRPEWSAMNLRAMLADARQKSRYGPMVQRVVMRGDKPIGLFIYHAHPRGIAHVLQVAALPGRLEDVVDCLFAQAFDAGLAGLRGRTQPALLDAMLVRNCWFRHRSSTVVISRNQVLLQYVANGKAFINGLGGETWSRLIGDELK